MPAFQIAADDGKSYTIDAESLAVATRAAIENGITPAPPPGEIIHGGDRSYVTGSPSSADPLVQQTNPQTGAFDPVAGEVPPYVSTKGMASGIGMEAERRALAGQPSPFEGFLDPHLGRSGQSREIPGPDAASRAEAASALQMRQRGNTLPPSMQMFGQGATMSAADEFNSLIFGARQKMGGRPFGESYNVAQEAQRQDVEQERTEHPGRSTALQVGGALAQAPALMAAGVPLAGVGASPGMRALTGGGIGGLYGGGEGFLSGSGLGERLGHAKTGAAIGGEVGGLTPLLGEAGRGLTQRGLDEATVNRRFRDLGVSPPAGRAVTRALESDAAFGYGPGAANINAAGPDAMLADAGPTSAGMLDTAIQRGGPGTRIGREAVNARGEAANTTLNRGLDAALGLPYGITRTTTAIRTAGAPEREAAYNAAYAKPIDYSAPGGRTLQDLLEKRVPPEALASAKRLLRIDGHESQQMLADIAADGTVTFHRMPDVRELDYLTRGLNDVAGDVGKLGGQKYTEKGLTKLAGEIRGQLKRLVPEYGTALETAADDISAVQAVNLGGKMMQPGMMRDEVAEVVQNMSKPELAAVRQGVRSYIDDLMANVKAPYSTEQQTAEALTALRTLNSRAAQQKLGLILDNVQAVSLQRQIEIATKSAELYARTARNSGTYGRLAADQAVEQAEQPGIVGSFLEGKPLQAMQRGMQWLTGRTPQDKLAASDQTYAEISDLLTRQRYPAGSAMPPMQPLESASANMPRNAAIAHGVGAGIGLTSPAQYQAYQEWLRSQAR